MISIIFLAVLAYSLVEYTVAFRPSYLATSRSRSGVKSVQMNRTGNRRFKLQANLDKDMSGTLTPTIESSVRLYQRVSVLSWWGQIILSVVSGTILTFANTVRTSSSVSLWGSGFAFSGIGVILAFMNSFWTWNTTRMAKRASKGKIKSENILPTLRKYSKVSVTLSLVGMLVSLLGAEQIVGTLASKVLSNQGYVPVMNAVTATNPQIQALDIFLVSAIDEDSKLGRDVVPYCCYYIQLWLVLVALPHPYHVHAIQPSIVTITPCHHPTSVALQVQANTNCLVAHFIPLVIYLWAQTKMPGSESANDS